MVEATIHSTADAAPAVVSAENREPAKGVPITRYCDEQRLPLERRLELFVAVCRSVQHAHQKLVLHGKLSPANVVVAGADATPRVIGWGAADAQRGGRLPQS